MTREPEVPPELEDLDRELRRIRFTPRASLGPEVLGRLRRGEPQETPARVGRRRPIFAAAASVLVILGAALLSRAPAPVAVDRCCYDLDGGGEADDGVMLFAQRDATVRRLRIYEDLDRSASFTGGDLVRLERGEAPAMHEAAAAGLVTFEHCCLDFDGGGPPDDGLIVLGVPPDRVIMAAIYERPDGAASGRSSLDGFPLR